MKVSRTKLLASAVIVAATATVVIAGSAAANAADQEKPVSDKVWFVAEADANYDLHALYAPAGRNDQLPTIVDPAELGSEGLRPETVRFVAADDQASTYVALNRSNLLCLIVYIPGKEWTAGSTCTTPERFVESGLGLRVGNPSTAYESYLISDAAVSKTSQFTKSAQIISPESNLLVVDPELPARARAILNEQSRSLPVSFLEMAMSDEP